MRALQMSQPDLGALAPASTITNCAAFATGDLLRRVSLIAYRTSQLRAAHPSAGFAEGERQVWENHPDWQPARRALELALVAYDWAECLTAVNLVLRPTLDEMLLHQLGLVAQTSGDHLTWLLLGNLAVDTERSAGWSAALARPAVEVRAYVDSCPHQRSRLSEGELAGRALTCGTHRWEFDALTGQGLNPSISQLARLPVRVQEGMIEVMVEAGRSGLRGGIER